MTNLTLYQNISFSNISVFNKSWVDYSLHLFNELDYPAYELDALFGINPLYGKILLAFFATVFLITSLFIKRPNDLETALQSKKQLLEGEYNNKPSILLTCCNTTFKMGNKEIDSLFIYDRNDPSGSNLKGLFYIQNFNKRSLSDNGLHYSGYIKIGDKVQNKSGPDYFPGLYPIIGADIAINKNKLSELQEKVHVFNTVEGDPLLVRPMLDEKGRIASSEKYHAYLKNWAEYAYPIH